MKTTARHHAIWPLLLLIGLIAGCGEPQAQTEEEAEPAVPVAVAAVARGDIDATYRGTASIVASAEATVAAKIGGIVQSIRVEEGQAVEAGDTLAQLESERLALEVDRARAQYRQLQNDFARNTRVYDQDIISREAYDRTRFELEAAKAALELAELNLRESTIKASIRGVISRRHIKLGNTVQVGTALFDITRLDALEADLHVPEREIHKLQPGQRAVATVDAWPGERFVGAISRINPVVDAGSGTVKVTIAFDNSAHRLRPGMFGRLQVEYDRRTDTLLIPKDAVVIEDASASVFVATDGKALRRTIELGYENGQHYEVRAGLEHGEQVVTTGRASLRDGTPIDIVDAAS